jgi:hypothetical protein
MRRLILVTILCLISTPAFACVFHTDCCPGAQCIDGVCSANGLCKTIMTRLLVRPRTIPPPRARAATTIVIAAKAAASRAQA